MKNSTEQIVDKFKKDYPVLIECPVKEAIEELITCYRIKKKILICGNGGSAADAMHIVGELMKGFLLPRRLAFDTQEKLKLMFPETAPCFIEHMQEALPAISLVSELALLTACANDQQADMVFAQQVLGYGEAGDVLIAISTSGNSKNIIYAAQMAKVKNMKVVALTGRNGGKLKMLSDVLINAPFDKTYVIQEYHLPIYHTLCAAVENEFFGHER